MDLERKERDSIVQEAGCTFAGLAKMIREMRKKMGEMKRQLDAKSQEVIWLSMKNQDLQSELDQLKKLDEKRTEIYCKTGKDLVNSKKIVDQLNEKIKKLEAEKSEEEIRKRGVTQRRQNLEEGIENIFRDTMPALPPPHVLEKLVFKIHQSLVYILELPEDQGSSGGTCSKIQKNPNPIVLKRDNYVAPSSSETSTDITSPPHILKQKVINAHQNLSAIQQVPDGQGFSRNDTQDQENVISVGPETNYSAAPSSSKVSTVHIKKYVPTQPRILKQMMSNVQQNLSPIQQVPYWQGVCENNSQEQQTRISVGPIENNDCAPSSSQVSPVHIHDLEEFPHL